MLSTRRPFSVAVCAKTGQAPKQAAPRTTDNVRRISQLAKPALVLPAIFGRASAAFADELQQASDAAGEAGRQALSASQVPQWSNVQVPSGIKSPDLVNLFSGSEGVNPLLLLGAVASIAIPALLFQALNPGSKAKSTSPANVLKALIDEPRTVLVDIRSSQSAKSQGSPDLSSTKRRAVAVPYTRVTKRGEAEEPIEGFGAKLTKLSAVKPDSVIILLDADGKLAAKAAADVPSDEYDSLFYVAGGAAAWEASGQPWKAPGKGFSIDLSGLSQTLSRTAGTLKVKASQAAGSTGGSAEHLLAAQAGEVDRTAILTAGGAVRDVVLAGKVDPKTVLAAGGAALGALLLFNQTGLFLEVVGLGAAANLVYKNFFYAEDRERTTQKLKKLLDEEVGVQDAGRDFKRLADTVLESGEEVANAGASKIEPAAKDAKSRVSRAADDVADKAGSAAKDVKSEASSAAGKVTGKAEQTADRAANGSSGAADSVESAAEEAKAKASEAKEDAKQWIDSWRNKQ